MSLLLMITTVLPLTLKKFTLLRLTLSIHPFPLYHSSVQPVHVYVSRGKEDVSIKVVDEGGGIKRSSLPRIWSYFYGSGCTIERGTAESDEKGLPYRKRFGKTFQGSGMGLPLARLYSCYFGELLPAAIDAAIPVPCGLKSLPIDASTHFSCAVLPA